MQVKTLRRAGLAAAVVAGAMAVTAGAASATVFTVTNTADTGAGSLRQAITSANAASGADEVRFNIPGAGSHTIAVTSAPLPVVTGRLKIDGATEPGFAGIPLIRIDNNTGTTFTNGIDISVGNSQVLSLSITGFGGGVSLRTNGANMVAGNRLGLTPSGTVDGNVVGVGIVGGSAGNTIGGTTAAARNVLSGNSEGVFIDASNANKIQGNFVGVSPTGAAAMPNTAAGIRVTGAAKNTVVGGTVAGSGNVISANVGGGININGAGTSGTVVAGNKIGTNLAGTAALPNSQFGVGILGAATGNTVGGVTATGRNIISGNKNASGVGIGGAGTDGNVVAGNFIGTNAAGTAALPNTRGVLVSGGASGNTVGGDRSTARNLISGNDGNGVHIDGAGTEDNIVAGNDIGLNLAGTRPCRTSPACCIEGGGKPRSAGRSRRAAQRHLGQLLLGRPDRLRHDERQRRPRNFIGTTPGRRGGPAQRSSGVPSPAPRGQHRRRHDERRAQRLSGNAARASTIDKRRQRGDRQLPWHGANGADPLGNDGRGVDSGAGSQSNRIGGSTNGQRNVSRPTTAAGSARRRADGTSSRATSSGLRRTAPRRSPTPARASSSIRGERQHGRRHPAAGPATLIAFNGGPGVQVDSARRASDGNAILRNSIVTTPCSASSWSAAPTTRRRPPDSPAVTLAATRTTIKGTLRGGPATSPFRIEAFVSRLRRHRRRRRQELPGRQGDHHERGRRRHVLAEARSAGRGQQITATATRASGPQNTSAFSQCRPT